MKHAMIGLACLLLLACQPAEKGPPRQRLLIDQRQMEIEAIEDESDFLVRANQEDLRVMKRFAAIHGKRTPEEVEQWESATGRVARRLARLDFLRSEWERRRSELKKDR